MVNYSMIYSASEAAHLLEVDKKVILKMTILFKEYLSPNANPEKGIERKYCIEDIRILSYVSTYWEDEPDIVNIKYGLNANEHFETPINEFIIGITPLFREVTTDIDDSWKNVLIFGGLSNLGDLFFLAKSYKLAGDILIDNIISTKEYDYELICPIIYNYRHATELFLKSTVKYEKENHNLLLFYEKFKIKVNNEYKSKVPLWFENIILDFNYFDPKSTTFRYPSTIPNDEILIDLVHLKDKMNRLADIFQRINDFHNY